MLWVVVVLVFFQCDAIKCEHFLHIDAIVCHCPSQSACALATNMRHVTDEALATMTMTCTDRVSSACSDRETQEK